MMTCFWCYKDKICLALFPLEKSENCYSSQRKINFNLNLLSPK